MLHELKILKKYYDEVKNGDKQFEVRKKDRDYKVGDFIGLNPIHTISNSNENDDWLLCEITYVLDNKDYCKDGYVILGIKLRRFEKEEKIHGFKEY